MSAVKDGNCLVRALIATVWLLATSFMFFFVLQAVAYRIHIFSYLGLNLFVLSLGVSLTIAVVGPYIITRFVKTRYERRLISALAAIAFLGYINVYNIVFPISLERSFSVRILVNLANAPDNALEKNVLEKLQSNEKIYGLRYREMSGAGLIYISGETVKLTTRGKAIAFVYVFLGNVMGYSNGFECAAMEKCAE